MRAALVSPPELFNRIRMVPVIQVRVVVKQIPLSLVLHDGMVVGPAVHGLQDHSPVREWSQGIVARAILDLPAAGRIRQVIRPVVFVHPHGLKKIIRPFQQVYLPVVRDHVFVQLDGIDHQLSHIEVGLAVIVNEDRRVNEIAGAHHPPAFCVNQCRVQRIPEGTVRGVGNRHPDPGGLHRVIEIILPVAFYAVRSPRTGRGPADTVQGKDHPVIRPLLHIGRGKHMPVLHAEVHGIILVVRRIYKQGVVKDTCRGIGRVHMCDKRVTASLRASASAQSLQFCLHIGKHQAHVKAVVNTDEAASGIFKKLSPLIYLRSRNKAVKAG